MGLLQFFRKAPPEARPTAQEGEAAAATGVLVSQARAFHDLRVEDVMKPRADIVAIDRTCTFAELVDRFVEAEHSRMPVYKETLDEPVGVVHVKDVFRLLARKTGRPKSEDQVLAGRRHLVRPVLYVPASMRAAELLALMRARQTHMALVIDEFGGTDGLATLEDLLERLVGEIADEHDEESPPGVIRQSDGSFLADARASLEDLGTIIGAEFDVGEVAKEVDTLAGYVATRIGRVPVRGELVPGPGPFELEILDADPRRVKKLRIYRNLNRDNGGRRGEQRLPATGGPTAASSLPVTGDETVKLSPDATAKSPRRP
jgi:CBS domain containing-hemolysin-like protein